MALDIWSQAANALGRADELVIAGYSLPGADERARALLLGTDNRSARVIIICGSDTQRIVREFQDRGFRHVSGGKELLFQDWVAAASRSGCDVSSHSSSSYNIDRGFLPTGGEV